MGARLKYSASCCALHTTLTMLGLCQSSHVRSGWAAVAMGAVGVLASCWATAAGRAGSISGSSPCTLTTMASSGSCNRAQACASRSLPLACSAPVRMASTPKSAQACTMRGWSAATTTRAAAWALSACCTRCATRTTMGMPAMSASGFSGRRVLCRRAGISTVCVMMWCPQGAWRAPFLLLLRSGCALRVRA